MQLTSRVDLLRHKSLFCSRGEAGVSAVSLDQPGSCSVLQLKPFRPCYLTPRPPLYPTLFFPESPLSSVTACSVKCPGSDFCPTPLGSLYVLSVSLFLQGTVLKAFAARKISLTSEYLLTGGTVCRHAWQRSQSSSRWKGFFLLTYYFHSRLMGRLSN